MGADRAWHPRGTKVTSRTIEGHRAMSGSRCPGDASYAMVRDEFAAKVTSLLSL